MFEVMKRGAIVCNSGHFNVEIEQGRRSTRSPSRRSEARPFVEGHRTDDGREIFLLAEGRLVNLAAAEGHPAAVMDMSFANQALAAEHMVKHHDELEKQGLPRARGDRQRDRAPEARPHAGSRSTQLTAEQEKYLASWDQGT